MSRLLLIWRVSGAEAVSYTHLGCLVDGLGHGFIIPIHEGYAERFPGEDMYHYLLQQIHSMPPWNSLSDLN